MAVDVGGVTATPLIQQSPATQTNDLYALFNYDPSGQGHFYAPYSTDPAGILERKADVERMYVSAVVRAPIPAVHFFDPPAARVPTAPAPDQRFVSIFVKFPMGADLSSYGTPAPKPVVDPYPAYLREKLPDYFKKFGK